MRWHPNALTNRREPYWTRHQPPTRRCGVYEVLALPTAKVRRYLAVHEAGHVIAGLATGHTLIRATIGTAYERPAGINHTIDTWAQWAPPHAWEAYAIRCAGGERAQDQWLRKRRLWTPERAWATEALACSDREDAAEMGRRFEPHVAITWGGNGEVPQRWRQVDWSKIQALTDELLTQRWDDVLAVAAALDDRGTLTGADVQKLLTTYRALHGKL